MASRFEETESAVVAAVDNFGRAADPIAIAVIRPLDFRKVRRLLREDLLMIASGPDAGVNLTRFRRRRQRR
jgi:hypothetical protein